MRGRKSSLVVTLSPQERQVLEYRLRCTTTPLGLARRCQAILAVADGLSLVELAPEVSLSDVRERTDAEVGTALSVRHS